MYFYSVWRLGEKNGQMEITFNGKKRDAKTVWYWLNRWHKSFRNGIVKSVYMYKCMQSVTTTCYYIFIGTYTGITICSTVSNHRIYSTKFMSFWMCKTPSTTIVFFFLMCARFQITIFLRIEKWNIYEFQIHFESICMGEMGERDGFSGGKNNIQKIPNTQSIAKDTGSDEIIINK